MHEPGTSVGADAKPGGIGGDREVGRSRIARFLCVRRPVQGDELLKDAGARFTGKKECELECDCAAGRKEGRKEAVCVCVL